MWEFKQLDKQVRDQLRIKYILHSVAKSVGISIGKQKGNDEGKEATIDDEDDDDEEDDDDDVKDETRKETTITNKRSYHKMASVRPMDGEIDSPVAGIGDLSSSPPASGSNVASESTQLKRRPFTTLVQIFSRFDMAWRCIWHQFNCCYHDSSILLSIC